MPTPNSSGVLPAHRRPYRTLLASFAAWKLFLFVIALGSTLVGDAYDTSAGLVVGGAPRHLGVASAAGASPGSGDTHAPLLTTGRGRELVARFASWDAIYFVSIARRGYRFEQDWAFGGGLPVVVRWILRGLGQLGLVVSSAADEGAVAEALTGIAVSNVAHLLSVFVLYRLSHVVWRDQTLSVVTALLHVITPGGLFLCAANAESSFALLSFTGYLLFALGCRAEKQPARRDLLTIAAGAVFGLATAFRSNGILNGMPFAWEVLRALPKLSSRPISTLRRLLALGIGGAAVAAGSIGPQTVAYLRYCSGTSGAEPRPWCQGYLPSIYTFVQKHYWNTGFLRYWTLSNAPLFLLATPMLLVLTRSGAAYLTDRRLLVAEKPTEWARLFSLVQSTAAAQVLLAVLAATSYHVQIITRISSGCPLWYWWIAGRLTRGERMGKRIVMFMVVYASVQGALFTSFLPPA